MNKDIRKAEKLIREFVIEKLDCNWAKLLEFDLRTLENDDKFGCPDRRFDCDDSELMRAFYVLLWGDDFPELTFENLGTNRMYRGDTMNTFHTMFGRPIEGKEGFFAGLEKYSPSDELRQKVRDFSKIISRIGNYIVLPNRSADGETLNTFRGCNDWHDFFPLFLQAVENSLLGNAAHDEAFDCLMSENAFFFDKFKGKKGFFDFILKTFCIDYLDNKIVFDDEYTAVLHGRARQDFPLNFHWKNVDDREKYLADAEKYIDLAAPLIIKRTEIMTAAAVSKIFVGSSSQLFAM